MLSSRTYRIYREYTECCRAASLRLRQSGQCLLDAILVLPRDVGIALGFFSPLHVSPPVRDQSPCLRTSFVVIVVWRRNQLQSSPEVIRAGLFANLRWQAELPPSLSCKIHGDVKTVVELDRLIKTCNRCIQELHMARMI